MALFRRLAGIPAAATPRTVSGPRVPLEGASRFVSHQVTKGSQAEEVELIGTIGEEKWKRRNLEEEWKRRKEETRKSAMRLLVYKSSLYRNSTYCSGYPFTRRKGFKRIDLPTHYAEVNYRTLQAVIFYGPKIGHIPHDIRLKDPNLLLQSGGRGQNI